MSTTGQTLSTLTKYKIGLANSKDRTELYARVNKYIEGLKDSDFPMIVSASLHAGISEQALLNHEALTAENSEIRVLLNHIRDKQKEYLVKKGLLKEIDGRLTGLLLKADHGLKEEPTNLTQNNTFNVSPEILAEAILLSRTNLRDKKD